MNDIQSLNRKYNTLESILTSSGKLNTAIIRRDFFEKLDIFQKIHEDTKELDEFENVSFKDRVAYLRDGMKIEKCPFCGKDYINFEHSQKMYRLCNHHFNTNRAALSNALTTAKEQKRNELLNSLKDKRTILKSELFSKKLENAFNSRKNYNFSITKDTLPFLHDVVIKTESIIPFESNNPRFSERIYILHENLCGIPKCAYCDSEVSFRGRTLGYSTTCKNHFQLLGSKNKADNSINKLISSINEEKYEIVKLPSKLTMDSLIIKCKKCGKKSEWNVKNGMLGHIHDKLMCRFCERSHSAAEEELYEMVKKYGGSDILFKNGNRKIIPPYELDIYIPSKKLAIEFDGLYWHSEFNGGKDRKYHLMKTEKCEEIGIQLIHVFENEWNNKRKITESRIKNLLGVYDSTVYARNCEISEISPDVSRKFLNENHIQGACNSSVRVGLFKDGSLISLMTFSRPRFRKDGTEWEIVRFCNKTGYHIPGGASKLLKWFERKYNPKNLISYADRRWSNGKLYKALGFSLIGKSKPNYWYLKNTYDEPINRVRCQKHRLSKILDVFDNKLSEHENMRNNGYDRIFDCGNLVFMKNY